MRSTSGLCGFLPLVFSALASAQFAQTSGPNQPCNPDRDVLLLDYSAANAAAYLRCMPIGISGMGYWQQNFCPSGMSFDFTTQTCRMGPATPVQGQAIRKEDLLNIAILNGSCANGELCIGSTICDPNERRCLCPRGTVANLETLSCTPTASHGDGSLRPADLPTSTSSLPVGGSLRAEPTASAALVTAGPGESCARGEACTGGSFCMKIVGLCLCPNELEGYNGQCVHPKFAKNRLPRVPLGAACGNMVTCDHGSVCINGMCQCMSPAIEHHGRCVEYVLPSKLVGPGELCNEGQVCSKGSVCDPKIPVCVCPAGTDLDNGQCVQVRTTLAALNTFYTKPNKVFTESQPFSRYAAAMPTAMSGAGGEKRLLVYPTVSIPGTAHPQPHAPYNGGVQPAAYQPPQAIVQPPQSTTTPPTSRAPPNPFQLTSNRRLGVGAACSLNADCLSDAYCNGNTQPPTCQCLATHVPINAKCEKIIFPGQTGCFDDRQCGAAFPLARCLNRQCVCPLGTKAMDQTCVAVALMLGSICDVANVHRRCPPGAHCWESVCRCVPPLVQSGEDCVPSNSIDEPTATPPAWPQACADSRECPRGYLCMEQTCKCAWDGTTSTDCPTAAAAFESAASSTSSPTSTTTTAKSRPQFGDPNDGGGGTVETEEADTLAAIDAALTSVESSLLSRETAESLERIFNVILRLKLPNSGENQTDGQQRDAAPTEQTALGALEGMATAAEEEMQRLAQRQVFAMLADVVENGRSGEQDAETGRKGARSKVDEQKLIADLRTLVNSMPPSRFKRATQQKSGETDESPRSFPIGVASAEEPFAPFASNPIVSSSQRDDHQLAKRELNDAASVQVRQFGESCMPGDICLNGTSCIRSFCACPTGFVVKNDTCVRTEMKPLNARCAAGVDKCANGGACRNGRCVCADGSKEVQHRCRQSIGGRCAHGESCAGGSKCSTKSRRCECAGGGRTARNATSCLLQIVGAGADCRSGQVCAGSVCKDGQCTCLLGFTARGGKCLRSTQPAGTNVNVVRVVNATHSAVLPPAPVHFQQAAAAYARPPKAPMSPRSLKKSGLPITIAAAGERCGNNEACGGGSLCRDGICSCSDDEVIMDGKCVTSEGEALQALERISQSEPGQLCTDDTTCLHGSTCVSNICTCPDGWSLFRGVCLRTGHDADMATIHSQAAFFSPRAMDNLVDTTALKTLVPGAMCTLNLECPYRTDCIRGVCRCRKSETIVNGMCRRAIHEVPPGGRCDTQKGLDCIGESHCFYGICVCLYGLVNVGNECASAEILRNAEVGASCQPGQSCDGGATCIDGVCKCGKEEFIDENNHCAPNTPPNSQPQFTYPGQTKMSSHKNDKETIIYGSGAADEGRFNQILTAKQMSINVVDLETLKALVSGQFMKMPQAGDKCDGGMCGSNARCVRGLCQCQDGYTDNDGTCQAQESGGAAAAGGAESTDSQPQGGPSDGGYVDQMPQQQQLTGNGIGGFYQPYQPPYMAAGNPYVQGVGMPGSYCQPGNFCYGGSICMNGLCQCRAGYQPWGSQCQVARVPLGSPCYMNEQCVDNNGICTNGICSCGQGQVVPLNRHRFHRCPDRPTARPGEDCSSMQICTFNSICGSYSGVCECPIGMETTVARGSGECIPSRRARGAFCFSSANCHRNSYCDNGFCMCKAGFVPVENFCLPAPRAVVDDPRSLMGGGNELGAAVHTPPRNPAAAFEVAAAAKRTFHRHHARPAASQRIAAPTGRLQRARPGESCTRNTICIDGARCHRGFCKCPEGTRNDGHKCTKSKARRAHVHLPAAVRRAPWRGMPAAENGVGSDGHRLPFDSCELDRNSCADGSVCRRKAGLGLICVCAPDRLPFMGICIRRRTDVQPVALGDSCTPAEICTNGGECVNGRCSCTKDRTERAGFCVLEAKPGDSCMDGEFCASNSECRTDVGACVCPPNSRTSASPTTNGGCAPAGGGAEEAGGNATNSSVPPPSLRTALPGDLCDPQTRCLNGSYCSAFGFCNCGVGYIEVYSMCISADRVRAPGETCSAADNDICTNDSWCSQGRCKCLNRYEPFRGRCRHDYRTVNVPNAAGRKKSGVLTATSPQGRTRSTNHELPTAPPAPMPPSPLMPPVPPMPQMHPQHLMPPHGAQLPPVVQHGDPSSFGSPQSAAAALLQHQQKQQQSMPMMHPGRRNRPSIDEQADEQESQQPTGHWRSPNRPPPDDSPHRARNFSHHIRIYRLEHTCRSNHECPPGAYCMYSRCFCNKLPLRNKTSPTATTCALDNECMEPLNCMDGRCVCIQELPPISPVPPPMLPVPLPPLPLPTSPPATMPPLSPPTTTTTAAPAPPASAEVEQIVIPGAFCDHLRRCSFDAECHQGRCTCIDRKKTIVLRNGRSVCEFTEPRKPPRTTDRPTMPTDLPAAARCEFSSQCKRNFVCLHGSCVCIDPVDDTSCKEEDKRLPIRRIPSCRCVCPDPLMVIQGGECRRPQSSYPTAPPPTKPTVAPRAQPKPNGHQLMLQQQQQQQQQIQPQLVNLNGGQPVSSIAAAYMQQQRPQQLQQRPQQMQYAQQFVQPTHATQPPTRPSAPPPTIVSEKLQAAIETTVPPTTSAAPSLLTPRTVAPGHNCGPLDKCTGGSICIGGFCLCPAGMSPSAQGVCEARQFASTSGPEVPAVLEEVVRPNECSSSGLHCQGGTICIDHTCQCPLHTTLINDQCVPMGPGYSEPCRCVCPSNKPHIRNYICTSDDLIQKEKAASGAAWSCESSLKCPENAFCDGNECKCLPGHTRAQDKCIHVPKMLNVQPTTVKPNLAKQLVGKAPASPASASSDGPTVEELIRIQQAQLQHHLRQVEAEQLRRQQQQQNKVQIPPINPAAPRNASAHQQPLHLQVGQIQQIQRQHMQHQLAQLPAAAVHHLSPRAVPRIVGPRLKRPNAKTKVELGDVDRQAVCPPGNEPLRDEESGRLRVCNGLEPHCPPKSYCYVTGVASADYNCCTVP
ncbi:EGF-like domain protein [Aphelenchoides fujianensis]|nr:EGF-like domain protein [Aphelenchoides fujianensis]